MKKTKFYNLKVDKLIEDNFPEIVAIERKIYLNEDPDIIQGESLIEDIKKREGLEYSVVLYGEREYGKKREVIGYIVAINENMDKNKLSICLEDFAIIPEAQRQGLGWKIMEEFIKNLKGKHKPDFLYMHLRENSKAFMNKHQESLKEMGVELIEETTIADYYGIGKDTLCQLYELKN